MADKHKISIIVYVQDDKSLDAFWENLGLLEVPEGCQCDVLAIQGAANRAAAYREGSTDNDAKYKVYLDTKLRIRDKGILRRYLQIFQQHEEIAALDVAGNRIIPTNGICAAGRSRLGGVVFVNHKSDFTPVAEEYAEAEAVDGFLFATQYDLPWQVGKFSVFMVDDDSFLMTAQSVEYRKAGYKLAVVQQDKPCVSYRQLPQQGSERDRNSFLDMYSEDMFPKVLVVVQTYNRPRYVQIALRSVMEQTYRNLEIVVTDDSTNNETEKVMQGYLAKDKRIKYYKHENFTAVDHAIWSMRYMKNSPWEYVNWLMDDDIFYPAKIERMMTYYLEYEGISLVTSFRNCINDVGEVINGKGNDNESPFKSDTIVPGERAGRVLLLGGSNFIGEPSTVLVRKSLLREDGLWGWTDTLDWSRGLIDVATWLQLCTKGDMAYIVEPLSAFRLHAEQSQRNVDIYRCCKLHWASLLYYAVTQDKFLHTEEDRRKAMKIALGSVYACVEDMCQPHDPSQAFEREMLQVVYEFLTKVDAVNVAHNPYLEDKLQEGDFMHCELPIK